MQPSKLLNLSSLHSVLAHHKEHDTITAVTTFNMMTLLCGNIREWTDQHDNDITVIILIGMMTLLCAIIIDTDIREWIDPDMQYYQMVPLISIIFNSECIQKLSETNSNT